MWMEAYGYDAMRAHLRKTVIVDRGQTSGQCMICVLKSGEAIGGRCVSRHRDRYSNRYTEQEILISDVSRECLGWQDDNEDCKRGGHNMFLIDVREMRSRHNF